MFVAEKCKCGCFQVSLVQSVREVDQARRAHRVWLDSRVHEDRLDLLAVKDLRDRQDSPVQLVIPARKDGLDRLAFVVILDRLGSPETPEHLEL